MTLTVRNRFGEDTVSKKSLVYVVDSMPEKMDNLALKKYATARAPLLPPSAPRRPSTA